MSTKIVPIKGLPESEEIIESYTNGEYFDAVLKCRVFLESWLAEYIFAILFPDPKMSNAENRRFVSERFGDMFYQIMWLKDEGYISKTTYEKLNQMRKMSDNIFRSGDVLRVCSMAELKDLINSAIHYCQVFKDLTQKEINRSLVSE